MTSSGAPSARELTRRLAARTTVSGDTPEAIALGVQSACERIYRELGRSVGPAGAVALVTRALVGAQAEHPLLKEIRLGGQSEAALDGVAGAIQAHGAPAVVAALEALLETLLGLLGRLIGEDLVELLVDRSAPIKTQLAEDVK